MVIAPMPTKSNRIRPLKNRSAGLLIAVLAAAALAGCVQDDGSDDETNGSSDGPLASSLITMQDNKFDMTEPRGKAGERTEVIARNDGDTQHTFTIEGLGVDSGIIEPGESTRVQFTWPDEPTTFICTIHPEMQGTLTV